MKSLPLMLSAALICLSTSAIAQTEPKQSFDRLKTLAGSWEGHLTTLPVEPSVEGKPAKVSFRVTSMGNTLMHEMRIEGRPDDPITMLYIDGDRLLLTHFCDAGNQPRMSAKTSPDGKTVDFDFVDATGNMKYGHMKHATFTFIDENHHTEDWTFLMGDKAVRAHFELQRTQ